jgi:hypothetical protein
MTESMLGQAAQSQAEGQPAAVTQGATTAQVPPAATPAQQPSQANASPETPGAEAKSDAGIQPVKYELTVPEGRQYDAEVVSTFGDVAGELGIAQDKAQTLLDRVGATIQAREAERFQQWANEVKGDRDIGGANLAQNLAVAKKALDQFGSPELVQLLNATGIGNNVHVIRAFLKAGQAISEDRFVKGSAASTRDPARVLYPNMS